MHVVKGINVQFGDEDKVNRKKVIHITENAAKQIFSLLKTKKEYIGIRVKVLTNKGCYGKKYKMEYVIEQDKFDEVVVENVGNNFIKVFIDPKTLFSILGTTVDYVSGKFSSGFVFKNPKEKGRCGCGKSFH
ncbi:MAG: iron-sulfur cluster assembly accessory protein [Rickettsiaceae bacterium H1]|nr:iron-sulfur cluster assembly accessory protein [Rickettsiaceae bacterium H1]